jgi:YD repeat-containing protein
VLTIEDYKAGSPSPQTQTFSYDAAGRLESAVASGGSAGGYGYLEHVYDGAPYA